MKRNARRWDLPKPESKIITKNKRTQCVINETDGKSHFIEDSKSKRKP